MLRSLMVASLAGLVAAGCPAAPFFVGEQRLFVVEQEDGKNKRTVPAVEGTTDAETFYNYYSASSHTGLEQLDGSVLFLYRDATNPGSALDLFWIHGKQTSAQGYAEVDGVITGIPSGVSIAEADDAGEFRWTTATTPGVFQGANVPGPNAAGKWKYGSNTDGGALTGFPLDTEWSLRLDAVFRGDAKSWSFAFGDGSAPLALDMSEPVFLRPEVTAVGGGVLPYPQEVGATGTYCALAEFGEGDLDYTFSWGDGTSDTVVRKGSTKVACATHTFCGPISSTCGGTFPRSVTVSVEIVVNSCGVPGAGPKELALETGCAGGVSVEVDGGAVTEETGPTHLDLHKVPEQFDEMKRFAPTGVAQGSEVVLKCCGSTDCSFVVSTYHCPPCSQGKNGGFPATLPVSDFTAGSCAPRFGAHSNPMTSFHTTVPAGGSVTLPATSAAPHMVVFGRQGSLENWCPKPVRHDCFGPCPPTLCDCSTL